MKKYRRPSEANYRVYIDGYFNTNAPEEFNYLLGYVQASKQKSSPINETFVIINRVHDFD